LASEPDIIGWGRGSITGYDAKEFRTSLTRAFKDGRADFVVLDNNMRGQKFLAACVAWAVDRGWLYNDSSAGDEQCKVFSFRMTKAGKRALLG